MMLAVILPAIVWGQDKTPEVTAQAETLSAGGTSALAISLTNEGDNLYNGFQFDLFLPQGVTLAKNENNNFAYQFSDRYTSSNMSASIRDIGNGWYRVIAFSFTNVLITGNEGVVLTLTLQGSSDLAVGELTGKLTDVVLSRLDGKGIDCDGSEFSILVDKTRMGDVNFDKEVDLTDALLIVDYVLGKISPDFHAKYADMDKNKEIELNDALMIIDIVLGKN